MPETPETPVLTMQFLEPVRFLDRLNPYTIMLQRHSWRYVAADNSRLSTPENKQRILSDIFVAKKSKEPGLPHSNYQMV
jgi:hypothetical protein